MKCILISNLYPLFNNLTKQLIECSLDEYREMMVKDRKHYFTYKQMTNMIDKIYIDYKLEENKLDIYKDRTKIFIIENREEFDEFLPKLKETLTEEYLYKISNRKKILLMTGKSI